MECEPKRKRFNGVCRPWPVTFNGKIWVPVGRGQVDRRGIYSTPNLDVTTEHGYAKTIQKPKTKLSCRIGYRVNRVIQIPVWTKGLRRE